METTCRAKAQAHSHAENWTERRVNCRAICVVLVSFWRSHGSLVATHDLSPPLTLTKAEKARKSGYFKGKGDRDRRHSEDSTSQNAKEKTTLRADARRASRDGVSVPRGGAAEVTDEPDLIAGVQDSSEIAAGNRADGEGAIRFPQQGLFVLPMHARKGKLIRSGSWH